MIILGEIILVLILIAMLINNPVKAIISYIVASLLTAILMLFGMPIPIAGTVGFIGLFSIYFKA